MKPAAQPEGCVFCGRLVPTRGHHVIPRCKGGRQIVPTCRSCEDFIHGTWSHNELRDTFNTVERILADARFQRFLRWLRKQQEDAEVAHFRMAQWLEEGLAEYFSTSRFLKGQLVLGTVDPNTYPVWWIDDLATTPDLTANLNNGSVIPLRAIVTGHGGPSMNRHFNLYYLHWWSLTHCLFETARHRPAVTALLEQGGGLETFEKRIGPVDTVQAEWHDYVRHLKAVLAGHDPQFLRTGTVPPMTHAPGQP